MHQAGPLREGLQIRFFSARLNLNSQACYRMVFVLSATARHVRRSILTHHQPGPLAQWQLIVFLKDMEQDIPLPYWAFNGSAPSCVLFRPKVIDVAGRVHIGSFG